MANEKTLEILKEMKADPKAKELFEGMEAPTSSDEAIAVYAQIAEKLGYGITEDDIHEAVEQKEAERKARTNKVVSNLVALDDDDLEGVAGGFYYIGGDGQGAAFKVHDKCRNDYTDTSCNNSDACANLVHFYYDCSGKYFNKDEENDCAFSLYCELALRWK